MDRSKATYEAYDGVELRLLNGRVVHCAPLEVVEAVRWLRLLSRVDEGDFESHYTFLAEFPGRIGIDAVPLGDLGFSMTGPGDVELTADAMNVTAALGLVEMLAQAEGGDPNAQANFLDNFPGAIGADPEIMTPAGVFELGRAFAEQVYSLVYGLASDFSTHQTASPRSLVMTLERVRPTTMSTPGSTT